MLNLKQLRFSGIGRFVDEQAIDFTALSNLVQIDGKNLNTGGSSGSGKSTVFNALDYLLGLNDTPTTVLQSRLTKEPIKVTGLFSLHGETLEITRSRKGLKLDLGGQIIEGSAKISEEKLDELIGMPRHIFRKIIHKRQDEKGFFLDFTPKETHDFLTDCLNLSNLRKKIEIIEAKLKELNTNQETYTKNLESARTGLRATQDAIIALGLAPIRDISQETVLESKKRYDEATTAFNDTSSKNDLELKEIEKRGDAFESKYKARYDQLERPALLQDEFDKSELSLKEFQLTELKQALTSLQEKERTRKQELSNSITAMKLDIKNIDVIIRDGTLSVQESENIAKQIKIIRSCTCPMCSQAWASDDSKNTEKALMEDLKFHSKRVFNGKEAEKSKILLEQEIVKAASSMSADLFAQDVESTNIAINNIGMSIDSIKKEWDSFNDTRNAKNNEALALFYAKEKVIDTEKEAERIYLQEVDNKRKAELGAILEQARGQMDINRRVFEAALSKLKNYEEAKKRYEESFSTLKVQESEYAAKILDIAGKYDKLTKELEMVEEIKKAIKSYASCSFDDALALIGDNATRIVRNIPNMANATIQLEGVRETKDGKVKEEVNAIISSDGETNVPIRSLSGGERSAVDLAVDLAVIDFIESKAGKGSDIFILDEPFTGLGTVEIEMAIEVLKNAHINKKLIIVDHNPEVKEMVQDRLVVVRSGSTSNLTVGA